MRKLLGETVDFTKEGNIIIEDNNMDGEVLGHAVALGENTFESMLAAEVDTTPRTLSAEESFDAVHGLARMDQISRSPVFAANAVRRGGCVLRHALDQSPQAVDYLKEIALQAVVEASPGFSLARVAA